VVFRFWINNHFADDFLTSKSLRFQMALFLNKMRLHPRVQASPRDSRIIRSLMEFCKSQRRFYKGLAEQRLSANQNLESTQAMKEGSLHACGQSNQACLFSDDSKTEVEHVGVTTAQIPSLDYPQSRMATDSDHSASFHSTPIKGRLRASTLAGITSKSVSGDPFGTFAAVWCQRIAS
jgi:hypothetical protein